MDKKMIFLCFIAAVALFLSACGGTGNSNNGAPSYGEVVIREDGCVDLTGRHYGLIVDQIMDEDEGTGGDVMGGFLEFLPGNILFVVSAIDVGWGGWHSLECAGGILTVDFFGEATATITSDDGFDHLIMTYETADGILSESYLQNN